MSNITLRNAQRVKYDEFYTLYSDKIGRAHV